MFNADNIHLTDDRRLLFSERNTYLICLSVDRPSPPPTPPHRETILIAVNWTYSDIRASSIIKEARLSPEWLIAAKKKEEAVSYAD